ELPLEAQAKLLRVLQDGELRRLGATESRQVDVRIVAATNRDLRSMVAERTFREDLYFRLAVFRVELPPLRERAGDLPLLAEAILSKVTARGIPAAGLSVGALAELSRRQWRGNVRELQNVLERAAVFARGQAIEVEHLEPEDVGRELSPRLFERSFRDAKQLFALHYARQAVARANGSVAAAARAAQVTRQTLYRAIADGETLERELEEDEG
ncbi:MAG: sigma 54-interacting transcriptional regulator, partial [Planctomycetota bacterium]